MPYLVLYRLSKWFSLAQGKLSHPKQYLILSLTIFSQFLILHAIQDFDLELSPPLQPGHAFLSLTYARQRRQFIPQGAISVVGMAFVFIDCFRVIPIYRNGSYDYLSIEAEPAILSIGICFFFNHEGHENHEEEHRDYCESIPSCPLCSSCSSW